MNNISLVLYEFNVIALNFLIYMCDVLHRLKKVIILPRIYTSAVAKLDKS